jgi:hypothetical protein
VPARIDLPCHRWPSTSSLGQSRTSRCLPPEPVARWHCAGLPRPASLVRRSPAMVAFSPPAGLTTRSSGEPTACRLAREAALVIIGLAGQAAHRRLPLSSNVRPRQRRHANHRWISRQLSAVSLRDRSPAIASNATRGKANPLARQTTPGRDWSKSVYGASRRFIGQCVAAALAAASSREPALLWKVRQLQPYPASSSSPSDVGQVWRSGAA